MLTTVMVIDDNDSDLLYSRIMLERSGSVGKVLTFESAVEALDCLIAANCPAIDVILLDINMPEMSGFEFLQAYETVCADGLARAVVVMLTSSPDPRDRDRALAFASVKSYVTKPIDIDAARGLEEVVRRAEGHTA